MNFRAFKWLLPLLFVASLGYNSAVISGMDGLVYLITFTLTNVVVANLLHRLKRKTIITAAVPFSIVAALCTVFVPGKPWLGLFFLAVSSSVFKIVPSTLAGELSAEHKPFLNPAWNVVYHIGASLGYWILVGVDVQEYAIFSTIDIVLRATLPVLGLVPLFFIKEGSIPERKVTWLNRKQIRAYMARGRTPESLLRPGYWDMLKEFPERWAFTLLLGVASPWAGGGVLLRYMDPLNLFAHNHSRKVTTAARSTINIAVSIIALSFGWVEPRSNPSVILTLFAMIITCIPVVCLFGLLSETLGPVYEIIGPVIPPVLWLRGWIFAFFVALDLGMSAVYPNYLLSIWHPEFKARGMAISAIIPPWAAQLPPLLFPAKYDKLHLVLLPGLLCVAMTALLWVPEDNLAGEQPVKMEELEQMWAERFQHPHAE